MNDRKFLELLVKYHEQRHLAVISLLNAQQYFDMGYEQLCYRSLLRWAEARDEGNELRSQLFGAPNNVSKVMRADKIFNGR